MGATRPQTGFMESAFEALVKLVLGTVLWPAAHPRTLLSLAGMTFLGIVFGWVFIALSIGLTVMLLVAWRLLHPRWLWRLTRCLRSPWRRVWRYEVRWKAVMRAHGLTSSDREFEAVPRLGRVRAGDWGDHVRVRMLLGQTTGDYEHRAEALAHAFGARGVRVRELGPGQIELHVLHGDPLGEPMPPVPRPEHPVVDAVQIGVTENGDPWTLRVLGTHTLIAGATGSGKSSVVWSVIHGLLPAMHDGLVQVWAVDPKGGMELGMGRPLFARLATDAEPAAQLLEDAVEVMRRRAGQLAGATRQHQPTPREPLILVVLDEVAYLTAYVPDRKLRERIHLALAALLTQGRAVGVSVIAALQDPRKEVLSLRDLFPTRIAMRLSEPGQVDLVLGPGACERGARADLIPEDKPGIGWIAVDGVREPQRVRAGWITDLHLQAMASCCPSRTGTCASSTDTTTTRSS